MINKFLTLMLLLLLFPFVIHGELIPLTNQFNWNPGVTVGVIGGIDAANLTRTNIVDVTSNVYSNMDNTGVTNCGVALNTIVTGIPTNSVIYFPAGTFLFSSGIIINKSFLTLRGSGNNTIINFTGSGALFQTGTEDSSYGDQCLLLEDTNVGDTTIEVTEAASSWIGRIFDLRHLTWYATNDLRKYFSTYDYDIPHQRIYVTDVVGTTVSFYPQLCEPYTTNNSAMVRTFSRTIWTPKFVGIESMYINLTNSSSTKPVTLDNSFSCWISDVTIKWCKQYGIALYYAINAEIRRCFVDKQQPPLNSSNHGGMLINYSPAAYIYDNIILDVFPCIEMNAGSSGCIVAYNYIEFNQSGAALDANHSPHNSKNLFEGNISRNFMSDGYYGGSSEDMIYRNWFHGRGTNTPTTSGYGVALERFTRNSAVIGNILHFPGLIMTSGGISMGNPNMGNGSFEGYGPPWINKIIPYPGVTVTNIGTGLFSDSPIFWPSNAYSPGEGVYKVFIRDYGMQSLIAYNIQNYTNETNVSISVSSSGWTSTNVAFSPVATGWQESDTNVAATATIKGNYDFYTSTIDYPLGSDVLSNSLYLVSKPSWFGNIPWPPFNPSSPPAASAYSNAIPASARYHNLVYNYIYTNRVFTNRPSGGGRIYTNRIRIR